jgi:putative acetyltransferase
MAAVRLEHVEDIATTREINEAAFGTSAEAALVDLLRSRGQLVVSMVAEAAGRQVGHIAFSTVVCDGRPELRGAGLGPMAVLPRHQRRGLGSLLVRAGLERCSALAFDYVVVLGHPDYYPRFGFVPGQRFGLRCRWDVPENVFMALELRAGALAGASGLVAYRPEFDAV